MWNRLTFVLLTLSAIGAFSLLASDFPVLTKIGLPKYSVLIQPLVLSFGAVFLGMYAYRKMSFLRLPMAEFFLNRTSIDGVWMRRGLAFALAGSLIGGVLLYLISEFLLQDFFLEMNKSIRSSFLTKILYGGINEEIMLRWGLMLFLILILSKWFSQNRAIFLGLALSSLIFGLGHLPIAAVGVKDISVGLAIGVVGFNFLAGLLFGYAFVKFGLWCSILCHMGAHIWWAGISKSFS